MMFSGQTALVTGAARGIGRAVARKLACEGASVAVNYNRSADDARLLVEEIQDAGGKAMAFQADVSQFGQVMDLFKTIIEVWGQIDILVNNAGITRDTLIARMSEKDWDEVLEVNLKGYFNCCRAAVRPMLRARRGRIINISSVVGLIGSAGQVNYAAAKAGVVGITKSLARELGSRGITVNAIAPGFIDTDMTKSLSEDIKTQLLKEIPLERLGETGDIAGLVAFLASPEASYITGQVIAVDGGMSM